MGSQVEPSLCRERIELQGVNDCTVVGNSVYVTGYGISINGCYRVTAGENIIRNIVYYGLEATECDSVSFSGNVVSTTTATADLILESGTNTVITGGGLSGGATGIHAFGNRITISGVHFSLNASSCVNMQGASDVNISGCFFNQQAMARFLGIDATDLAMARINIVGCIFKGTTTDQGFMISSPNGHATTDITVSCNNTAGAVSAGGAFWTLSGSSLLTSFLRNRCFNNVGDGTATSPTKTFNVGYTATSSNLSMPYAYPPYEGGIVDFNASGGAKTMELPAATGLTGYTVTVSKADSSANAVTISVYGGGLINGTVSYALVGQYNSVTLRSNGTNWVIT